MNSNIERYKSNKKIINENKYYEFNHKPRYLKIHIEIYKREVYFYLDMTIFCVPAWHKAFET